MHMYMIVVSINNGHGRSTCVALIISNMQATTFDTANILKTLVYLRLQEGTVRFALFDIGRP